ncbi:MAG: hypothetical protein HY245_15350 [Rhizobiales bacterium]|nr:hypothetical protein [Hyphomicrobiales bacterium]MBI3674763.1 hypothetical protein [Hyphomicrobiales bacterium]
MQNCAAAGAAISRAIFAAERHGRLDEARGQGLCRHEFIAIATNRKACVKV